MHSHLQLSYHLTDRLLAAGNKLMHVHERNKFLLSGGHLAPSNPHLGVSGGADFRLPAQCIFLSLTAMYFLSLPK